MPLRAFPPVGTRKTLCMSALLGQLYHISPFLCNAFSQKSAAKPNSFVFSFFSQKSARSFSNYVIIKSVKICTEIGKRGSSCKIRHQAHFLPKSAISFFAPSSARCFGAARSPASKSDISSSIWSKAALSPSWFSRDTASLSPE